MPFAQRLVVNVIRLYQRTVSPDHGWWRNRYPLGWCRYYPSCSEYGRQAIVRFGLRRGVLLSLRRLVRCHPWSPGGLDPLAPRP
ncbi:MAG: membrane protein insertion efficiency factor YidD [Candidatus Kerfeldbacteria bacterium]|nr:membrane protein insertion efficiency factor YidD [Candidatus Kerfeldbacteria bacterium]